MIESNFYIQLNPLTKKFSLNDYLCILSIINIQQPQRIIIYHQLNNLESYFYYKSVLKNKINTKINFIKYNNFIDELILNIKKYGGIYIKNNFILLKKLNHYFLNDCFFYENCIYGFSKKCFEINENNIKIIIDKVFEIYSCKENILKLKDNIIYEQINLEILMKCIVDYNFYHYFKMIDNYLFLQIDFIENDLLTIQQLKESKITYMNLIIYYILGYSFYNTPKKIECHKSKLNFIFKGVSKIHWLNLNSCIERREKIRELFKNVSVINQRIEGYDGNMISNIKNNYFQQNERSTNNSNCEYAVLLSHLNMLKEAMNDNYVNSNDYILFLEDDICLDFGEYWNESIQEIINNAPDDCELIMLGYFSLNHNFKNKFRLWNNDWSAMSYIIKKSTLYKLNDIIDKNNKYKLFDDVNVADNYLFRLFKSYVYQYPIFTIPDNNTSTFHKDHDNYQKIYKNINYLILNDTINKHF